MKVHPVIGCCGIDCGLCPRFYTDGPSRCPGCAGEIFFEKHPSCPIITCCVKKKNLETCAECAEFPCDRMKAWDRADSFVTHRKTLLNLRGIARDGLPAFLEQQKVRIGLLEKMLDRYDDGRSKSFYCLAAALLAIEDLRDAVESMDVGEQWRDDEKTAAKRLKARLRQRAEKIGIELVYRKTSGRHTR